MKTDVDDKLSLSVPLTPPERRTFGLIVPIRTQRPRTRAVSHGPREVRHPPDPQTPRPAPPKNTAYNRRNRQPRLRHLANAKEINYATTTFFPTNNFRLKSIRIVPNQDSESLHRERLEAILANAVDAIVTIDERGIIHTANPATESMFGYSIGEMIGENVSLLMPSPFRREHDQYLKNYLTSGVRKIIGIGREVIGQRKDGLEFPVHLAVSEIRVKGQRTFTGIVRDITDVKTAEARLVQSERLAAIGQMVAGLAHESRNAFQRSHACLANLELDLQKMPESLELVHKVQSALDHVNSLLDEVRNYAAPIILDRTATDLERLVRDAWDNIIATCSKAKNVSLEVICAPEFPRNLSVDRRRFGQVFGNLLDNARVACGDGKVTVHMQMVSKTGSDASGDEYPRERCQIEIRDSGDGIELEILPQVFEPFFTTKTKGTGLGLAICQRIIDAHFGEISVANLPEGGAAFTIQFDVFN